MPFTWIHERDSLNRVKERDEMRREKTRQNEARRRKTGRDGAWRWINSCLVFIFSCTALIKYFSKHTNENRTEQFVDKRHVYWTTQFAWKKLFEFLWNFCFFVATHHYRHCNFIIFAVRCPVIEHRNSWEEHCFRSHVEQIEHKFALQNDVFHCPLHVLDVYTYKQIQSIKLLIRGKFSRNSKCSSAF